MSVRSIGIACAICLAVPAGAHAQAAVDGNALTARARHQLECSAVFLLLVEAYPRNWQTRQRERMYDAFLVLSSAGEQNLVRAGQPKPAAEAIVQARVDELIRQLEDGMPPEQFSAALKDCTRLHSETLRD